MGWLPRTDGSASTSLSVARSPPKVRLGNWLVTGCFNFSLLLVFLLIDLICSCFNPAEGIGSELSAGVFRGLESSSGNQFESWSLVSALSQISNAPEGQ